MPTLGEVLSGVLVDAIKSRVTADSISRDLVAQYRQDPVLSMLSVPRLAVRELQVTLRFVVQSFDVGPLSAAAVTEEWSTVLTDRIIPRVLEERGASLGADELGEVRSRVAQEPVRLSPEAMSAAMSEESRSLIDESVEAVLSGLRNVPPRLRRRVGTMAELREELRSQVTAELGDFLEGQRETTRIGAVHDSRLDVGIVRTDFETAPTTAVQEVMVKLTMEDIETLVGGGEAPATREARRS